MGSLIILETAQYDMEHDNTTYFESSIDYQWQFVAAYGVALVAYAFLRGSIESKELSVQLDDPFLVVLAILFALSLGNTIINWYMNRRVGIGVDHLVFANRLRERVFKTEDIESISLGRERIVRNKGEVRIVKIKLRNRKRLLRIRPFLYDREEELFSRLSALRDAISGS